MLAEQAIETTGTSGEPGAGPWASLALRWSGQVVAEAAFATYPCPNAHRCCGWVCRWVVGRTAEQARVLTADDLCTVIGGLPLGKEHCAELAVEALRVALEAAQRGDNGDDQGHGAHPPGGGPGTLSPGALGVAGRGDVAGRR